MQIKTLEKMIFEIEKIFKFTKYNVQTEMPSSENANFLIIFLSKSAGAKGDVPKICGFVHPC